MSRVLSTNFDDVTAFVVITAVICHGQTGPKTIELPGLVEDFFQVPENRPSQRKVVLKPFETINFQGANLLVSGSVLSLGPTNDQSATFFSP